MAEYEFVSKERLLEELKAGRERLEATLAGVSDTGGSQTRLYPPRGHA